jgi:hypothetical protein
MPFLDQLAKNIFNLLHTARNLWHVVFCHRKLRAIR